MLKDFATWWFERLRELAPARLSGADWRHGPTLAVEAPDGVHGPLSLSLQRGRQTGPLNTRALGRVAPDAASVRAALRSRPSRIVLRLHDDLLLGRDLILPLTAERELLRIVGYEIGRVTPFTAAELFWTYAVRHRDKARGRLVVQLVLVTRASVQPLLDVLAAAGIAPTLLDAAMPEGNRVQIDPRGGGPATRLPGAQRTNRVFAMACVALLLAVAATPFVRQGQLLARVDAEIAALRPQVEAADVARRRLATASAGLDVTAAEGLRLGNTLAVLATITDLLPDDTTLTELSLRQGKLTLGGQSAAAARLIPALAADPLLRNPSFAAPVTRLNNSRDDLFAIRAEIAP